MAEIVDITNGTTNNMMKRGSGIVFAQWLSITFWRALMSRKRIAISIEDETGMDSLVCRTFGKSPYCVIVDVDEERLIDIKVNINSLFGGSQLGLLHTLHCCGATLLLVGGMEPRVQGMLNDIGVEVVCDLAGTAKEVLGEYLSAKMISARGQYSPNMRTASAYTA